MKKIAKKSLCMLLAAVMALGLLVPAFAEFDSSILLITALNGNWVDVNGDGTEWTCTADTVLSRLQFMNSASSGTWVLTFDYEKTGALRAGSTALSEASGTYTCDLEANTPLTVTLNRNSTATISNIRFEKKAIPVSVTFLAPVNGSYTVNEIEITDDTTLDSDTVTGFEVCATPDEGYRFVRWIDVTNNVTLVGDALDNLYPDADITVKALFAKNAADNAPFLVDGIRFDFYADADEYAAENGFDTIVLVEDYTLIEDITVRQGTTLLIPFNDDYDCFTNEPAETMGDPRVTDTYETPTPYKTLTVGEGVTLTVDGKLSVSAKFKSIAGDAATRTEYGPSGPYGCIELEADSWIDVRGGLYAYGYVTGEGQITVDNGAEVWETMQIADYRGGSASISAYDDYGVFPFSQYYVQNIEAPMQLNPEATETVFTSLFAGSAVAVAIEFVGHNGMFQIGEGCIKKAYDPQTDRLIFNIEGDSEIRGISLSLGDVGFDSSAVVLPMTNNISINVLSGSTRLDQDISFLPGTELTIAKGAYVEIAPGSAIYAYDRDEWLSDNYSRYGNFTALSYSPSRTYTRKLSDLKDCKIDINGTLHVFGEFYTTESGAEIITSEGSGKIIYWNAPGWNDTLCEVVQNGTDLAAASIHVVAAMLTNTYERVPFTYTDEAWDGDTYVWLADPGMWTLGYQLSFDANGGSGDMDPIGVSIDDPMVTIPACGFSYDGFDFVGWAEEPNGEAIYFKDDEIPLEGNATIYAIWTEAEEDEDYTVTFVLNGGRLQGNATAQMDVPPATTITLPSAVKTGHTLKWQDENEALYDAGDPYQINSDMTFTAVWTAETYTLSFNANAPTGTTASGSMDPITVTYGVAIDKPDCGFTVTGYGFNGWKDRAGNPYNTATLTFDEDTTLYAQWKINEYTVAYDVNGGSAVSPASFEVDYGTAITLATSTKANYTLKWKDAAGTEYNPGTSYTVTGNVSFTAVWTPVEYTVTVDYGNNNTASVTFTVEDVISSKLSTPAAWEGHSFQNKWLDQNNEEIDISENFTPAYTKISAVWTVDNYTLTYMLDGEIYGEIETVPYGAELTARQAPAAREGYTFSGWSTVPATMPAENLVITGSFNINTYTVTWVIDGASASETYNYGATPAHADPTKAPAANEDGVYTFAGWNPALAAVTANATYTAAFTYTGWRTDETGKQYFIADELQKTGFTEINGKSYYLDTETGYAAVNAVVSISSNDPGHAFNADGEWMEGCAEQVFTCANGDIYLIDDGIVITFPGLYKIAGDEYYYFGADDKAVKDGVYWVEKNQSDPSDVTDRGLLPKWDYEFDENGIIVHDDVELDGVVPVQGVKYYYIDGIRVHYGMFEMDGDYYYADRNGKLIVNRTYWCSDNYGLFEEGPYTFDGDGCMVMPDAPKNGIYAEDDSLFYYVDGARTYAGLIEIDGDYYYVKTNGEVVHGRSYWITKTNGLLPEKAYNFDADGKMSMKTGIFEEDGSLYYYEDGVRTYAGLIEINGDYYYVKTGGEVVCGRSYWISKTNGLLPEKAYNFNDDGKMSMKTGIYEENGSLWYYQDGVLFYAGLIEIDGDYYYVKTSGEVVHGRKYWISKTNGLLPEKAYNFADDGKLVLN